jgi:hypothetical protein
VILVERRCCVIETLLAWRRNKGDVLGEAILPQLYTEFILERRPLGYDFCFCHLQFVVIFGTGADLFLY